LLRLHDGVNDKDRADLEQSCVVAEQRFAQLWALRGCTTFSRVSEGERRAIERSSCQVKVPEVES
jgi:hypothetical protein